MSSERGAFLVVKLRRARRGVACHLRGAFERLGAADRKATFFSTTAFHSSSCQPTNFVVCFTAADTTPPPRP